MTNSMKVKHHLALIDFISPADTVFAYYYRYRAGNLSSPHFILFI